MTRANVTHQPWMLDALCRQIGGDLMYPERGESNHAAKRICGACEVRPECLAYALEHDEREGVWGGTSGTERRALRRALRRRAA